MIRPFLVATLIATAGAVAACGADSGGPVTTVVQQMPPAKTVTVEAPPSAESQAATEAAAAEAEEAAREEEPEAASGSGGGKDRVPDVEGERLDVAEDELDDAGLPYKEIGGGAFGVVDPSNWVVCETKPRPGKTASGTVKLIVDRPGEC